MPVQQSTALTTEDPGTAADFASPRRRGNRVDTTSATVNRPLALALAFLALAALAVWLLIVSRGVDDPRMLVVDEEGAVSLLDVASGDTLYTLPGAVATPDRSTLLTAWPDGDATVLSTRDAADGKVTGRTTLQGDLEIRTVSPRGGAVALLPEGTRGDLYLPEPRVNTRLTVAYTDGRPARTYELDGNIEPEMFSLAEDALFVLSFDPPTDPAGYTVQRLDLASGALTDTAAPQVGLNPKMAGKARAQVLHPDGTFLYTLYTLTDAPVKDPAAVTQGGDDRWAFIHVINLDEQWSYCIFLEQPVGTGEEAAIGFGIAPDGQTLYVADSSTSTLTEVDPVGLTAESPQHIDQLLPDATAAAVAVAPDGALYLGSAHTVLQVDPTTFEVLRAWVVEGPVDGLAVDGDDLRVAFDGQVILIDRGTGTETGVLRAPRDGQLKLLGPPAGNATSFPVECAC